MSENINIVEGAQRSHDWLQNRLGCLTSSRIADALAKPKRGNGELQCRADYKLELAVERITNKPIGHYVSVDMQRGIDEEPRARAAYELRTGSEVTLIDFVLHPSIRWGGCSPDGGVGEDGLVEFKVPRPTTHAEYLLAESIPEEYILQMAWQLACCPDRKWNDFVSFCSDFPEPLNLFICRMHRDNTLIADLEQQGMQFLAEVENLESRLKKGIAGTLRKSLEPVF
jgi:YqaJ-like viral recombinase domain